MIHNPYRNYDKGMDDAYMGKEPPADANLDYLRGYGYAEQLLERREPEQEDDRQQEQEFNPCDKCDGHPACEDFGCAYDAGLGRMVRKNIEPGNDDW